MKKGLMLFALAVILGSTVVYAETSTTTSTTTPQKKEDKIERKIEKIEDSALKKIQRLEQELAQRIESRPMMLEVGPKGKAFIRGTIQSVSSSTSSTTGSILVKTWGGNWTVVVYPDTEVIPKGAFPSGFQVGDYVGVRGQIDPDKTLTVDATVLRNWSRIVTVQVQRVEDKKKEEIKKLEDRLRNIQIEKNNSVPSNFVPSISADKARELALVAFPGGAVVKIQLEKEEGKVIWSVRFSNDKRVDIDALTGAVVRIK